MIEKQESSSLYYHTFLNYCQRFMSRILVLSRLFSLLSELTQDCTPKALNSSTVNNESYPPIERMNNLLDEVKVLRVALILRPATGGMRRHVSTLLSGLNAQKFDITLFAPPDFETDIEVPPYKRKNLSIPAKTSVITDLQNIRILSLALDGQFDIVHGQGLRGALYAVLAARKAHIPSLFTAHNLIASPGFLQKRVVRHLVSKSSACISVSQAVKDSISACEVLHKEKIFVIPNGLDMNRYLPPNSLQEVYDEFGLHWGAPRVLGAGRLSPEKGFDILIRAIAEVQLKIPNVSLVIAGKGGEEKPLRVLAKSLDVNLTLVGQVSPLSKMIYASDVVAIPSRQEGQGIVAIEAMACGKPVVASDVGGLRETIVHKISGLLFPVEDHNSLAKSLIKLLNDPERRATLGLAGKNRISSNFQVSQMIQQTEALYEKIGSKL